MDAQAILFPHQSHIRQHYPLGRDMLAADLDSLEVLIFTHLLDHIRSYEADAAWTREPADRRPDDSGWVGDSSLCLPHVRVSLAVAAELAGEATDEDDERWPETDAVPVIRRHHNLIWDRLDEHEVLGYAMQLGVALEADPLNLESAVGLAATALSALDGMLVGYEDVLAEHADNVVGWCLDTSFMPPAVAATLCAPSLQHAHAILGSLEKMTDVQQRHYTLLSSLV